LKCEELIDTLYQIDKYIKGATEMQQPPTVSKDGKNLRPKIDGVITDRRPVHPDLRGRVFEIFRGDRDDFFHEEVSWIYCWSVRSGQLKGWGKHKVTTDRYSLISGEVSVVLFDARDNSPSQMEFQVVHMSHQSVQLLYIPTGVWHLTINTSDTEAFLLNFKTVPFNHNAPDKEILPWNTKEIPFDVAAFISGTNISAL
jgi:dTDP-4-dehydrorhamnose 3,5-epimerase